MPRTLRPRRAARARVRDSRGARPRNPRGRRGRCRARRHRAATRCTTPRFCSTSKIVASSDARSRARATSVTSSGESPFVGSSMSSRRFVVEQGAADREHLLLPAREGARSPACRGLAARGTGRRRGRSAASASALGRRRFSSTVSPAKTSRSSGRSRPRGGRSCVCGSSRDVLAAAARSCPCDRDESHQCPEGRRLADAVAAEQRRDAAVATVERDPLEHVRLAEIDVQVVDLERRHDATALSRGTRSAPSRSP